MWFLIAILVVVVLGIAALTVHLILSWANRRGYVYYRNPERPPPHTLGLLEEIYQPSIEHVIEQETSDETRADQTDSGDTPEPGMPR